MKCRNCGCENPLGNAFCENCGVPLKAERDPEEQMGSASWGFIKNENVEQAAEDVEKSVNSEIDELELRFSDGVDEWKPTPAAGQRDRARRAQSEAAARRAAGGVFDEADKAADHAKKAVNERSTAAGKKTEETVKAARKRAEDDFEEVTAPPRNVNKTYRDTKQGSGSTAGKIGIVLILLAIAAIITAIVFVLKGGIGSKIGTGKKAEITVNPNNPDMYLITVPAKEGSKIVFEFGDGQLSEEYEVSHKNGIVFQLASAQLLPAEPIEGTTCEVTPKVYTKDAEGNLNPIEMPSVTINVPKLDITFETPDNFEAANGLVEVKGRIQPLQKAAQLTLNGQTLAVDDNGNFEYSEKKDKGEYTLEFEGRLPGHSIYHKTFTAKVEKILTADEIVVIPRSFVTRALNVEDFIRVNGTVPAGSTISVVSDDPAFSLRSEPVIDENGNFDFEVNLPEAAKAYPFTIICTLADGQVYERPFSVERPPVYNEYVPTVWPDNYDEMIKPNHLTDKRGFVLKGNIEEILRDDDYLVAKLNLDAGQSVIIEYHNHYSGATELVPGNHYVMFGYSLGLDEDNMLHMFIWFVQD
ncbi:MAG: zinc ribbon domain-containing protein [Clostridia bacterium]|nr:zinc ribbon domain-containing protein [Clostridia bacterium]